MERQLILLISLFLCPPLVRSEAQQGRWKTDGHSYNLKDKLLFGRGGRQRSSVQFVGGERWREGINVNLENKYYL